LHPDKPSKTLTTLPDDLLHYSEPRILTVRESARIQSFPDNFVFKGKYTTGGAMRTKECPRYTQVGNAVPPKMSYALSIAILKNEKLSFMDEKKSQGLSDRFPMGHGAALECPDKPYLIWSYTNGLGEKIERNNTDIFMNAVRTMIGELSRYRYELDNEANLPNPTDSDYTKIEENFKSFISPEGDKRWEEWIVSIGNGDFSFGPQKLDYIPKGSGSWKYKAINQQSFFDNIRDRFDYKDGFLDSDWKLFHDALQEHRLTIIHDVLPRFGICVS